MLRGVGLGNWLNLEHFMLGIPGTDRAIREAFRERFGEDGAATLWRAFYRHHIDEADIRYLGGLGLNSIRIPVSYRLFKDNGPEIESTTAVREIDRVLGYCERHGMLAILDLHAAPGGQNPDWHSDNDTGTSRFWEARAHRDAVTALWGRIAAHYRDNPVIGGYDLINEPCYFESSIDETMVSFYRSCIAAIRREDRDHLIFLEGNTYARDFSMFNENMDDNLAYSFHYYPFLQLGDRLAGGVSDRELGESLFRDVSMDHLQNTLKRPIWCGETGHPMHQSTTYPVLDRFLGLLESLNVSWALWPYKDARAMGMVTPKADSRWMSLVSRATNQWSFWDIFSEDSILAANREADKSHFYKRLASLTREANQRFRERLQQIELGEFLTAMADWRLESCEPNAALIDIARCNPGG